MIDPDGIILTTENLSDHMNINEVPEYDFLCYDLEDEKGFKKYISDIEREVRSSYEYQKFCNYARNYMGMDQCAYLVNATNRENTKVRIEIHHYPFTLYDICNVVYKKREYYHESLEVEMVAKEVMSLHYKLMVGLISLSVTVHKLNHNGKLFIPVDRVLGRYELFIEFYKPFMTPEMLDIVNRIEKYTMEESQLLDTTILNTNHVTLNIKDQQYQLPDMSNVNQVMQQQIQTIKENGYQLPNVRDTPRIGLVQEERKAFRCPIYFDESLKEKYK